MSVSVQENDSPAVKGLIKEYDELTVSAIDKETGQLKDTSHLKDLQEIKEKIVAQREFEAMTAKDIPPDAPNPTDEPDKSKLNSGVKVSEQIDKAVNDFAAFYTKNQMGHFSTPVLDISSKALFEAPGGIDPYHDQRQEVVRSLYERIGLVDIVPMFPAGSDTVVWYEQTARTPTTRTQQTRDPGAVIRETAFNYTQRTVNIENVGVGVPVTREIMQDAGFIRALITEDLRRDLRDAQEADMYAVVTASGIPGSQTDNTATPSVKTALVNISNALGTLRKYDGIDPNFILCNAALWHRIVGRVQTAGDIYNAPAIVDTLQMRLYGIRVILSEKVADNHMVIGDSRSLRIFDRQQTRFYTEPRYGVVVPAVHASNANQTIPTHSDWLYVVARNVGVRVRPNAFYHFQNLTTTAE